MFSQDNTCPDLLKTSDKTFRVPDYHRLWPIFPNRSARFCPTYGSSLFARRY